MNLLAKQAVPAPRTLSPEEPNIEFEIVTVNDRGDVIERVQGKAEYRREDFGGGVFLDVGF